MKIYISKSHSDEDGSLAEEGKLGIIYSSKSDILELCDFFENVKNHLEKNDNCHMQLRDNFINWNKDKHIDLEINIIEE